MIHSSNGRSRSERTMEELEKSLAQELAHLSCEERETFELMLEEFRNEQETEGLAEIIGNAEWRSTPCDVETFVKDPYFLGITCENLYPQLLADMVEVFDGGYSEAVLTGCIELGAIIQSVNGSLHTIGEWIGKSGQVLGFSEAGGVPAATGLAKHSGTLPVVQLALANGMQQRLTPDHQVVVWRDGFEWLPAGEVVPDDLIIVARSIETSPDSDLSEDEAKLLAYWCTDGSSSEQRSRFCDGNPATSLEVVTLLRNLGFSGQRGPKGDRCWEVYVHEHKRSGFLSWLREHGGGEQTADVIVPDTVCRSSKKIVAAFLNRVWAAEGCVYCNPSKSPPRFTLGMTSERFVRQIQLLLLRFGIASRLQFTPQFDKRSGLTTEPWILSITGIGPLKRMLSAIGPILGKEEACSRIASYCAGRIENTNVDIVPISRKWLSKEMTQRDIVRSRGSKWWYLASGSGHYLSRSLFEEWLLEFGTTPLGKELEARFPPDLGFERVVSVSPMEEAEVGDICDVQEVSSFLSNGIYSHNSIGWGKCAKISSTYITTATGERELLQELIGRNPLVPSLQADGRIDYAEAAQIWHSGEKECARLTLASGQWLEASLDHPVLTPEGYKPLEALVAGEFVAAARTAPEPEHWLQISDAEVMCLGFYLADGSGLATGMQEYCKGNHDLVRLFEENVAKMPGFTGFGEKQYKRGAWYVRPHGLLPWLRSWGLDERSKEKRLPGRLFGLPRRQVALLLRVLWTDGNVYTGTPRKLELCLASEGLIDDVQEILRRFGIVARKSYQPKSIRLPDGSKKEYSAWRLQIADAATLRLFLTEVGPIFGLEQECARMLEDLQDVKSNSNWDVVPITIEELKKIRRSIGSIPNAEWSQYGSLAKGSHMGRAKFRALVAHFGYSGPYAKLASMDVVWERVVSVSSIGVHEVADLTVPGPANVVANGIVVHNTFFASIGICRILYELSCMKNPQRSFGLASQSGIAITNMSVTESLAIKVVFENIATKIKCSPYFQENFPFAATRKELRFPNSIWVAARSSTDTSALGLNTIAGIVDECSVEFSKVLLGDGTEVTVKDLLDRDSFDVSTFDFKRNKNAISSAFLKPSTHQECLELTLEDGSIFSASWNHPVAVRDSKGVLAFISICDIEEYQEVLVYAREGSKVVRSSQGTVTGGGQASGGEQESIFWEEPVQGASREGRGGAENSRTCASQRGDKGQNWGREQGEGHLRGPASGAVGEDEGPLGVGGQFASGAGAYVRGGQPDVRHASNAGAERPHRGHQSGPSLSRGTAGGHLDAVGDEYSGRSRSRADGERSGLYSEGGRNFGSGGLGVASAGAARSRSGGGSDRVRDADDSLRGSREEPLCCVRLPSVDAERISQSHRSEIPGQEALDQRAAQNRHRSELLREARLGIRGVGRELSVARVVSKRSLGVLPTYSICVPQYEVYVADGVVVHNTNFFAKSSNANAANTDLAESIYATMRRRMKSRFERQGKLPGMLFVVSSKRTNDDFTARRIISASNDPTVFVRDYALWDVKPEDYFDAAKFWVLVGNDKVSSKILDPGEERRFLDTPQEGTIVFDVPEDFRMDFQTDLEGAIRDIGGIATVSVNPYIQRRDTITMACDPARKHPFSELIYDPARKGTFMWDQMVSARTERVPGGLTEIVNRPKLNPMAPRAVHIDPSLRGDATGLVMAHIGGWKDVVRRADDGSKFMERAPIYVVDLALRIIPPMGGEIVLAELRHLIYNLTQHGYMITGASLDSYQSADTIQQLKSQGYRAEICSVDTSPDPYDNLKTAFYEGRVAMYPYQPLISELEALQEDRRGKKRKIDHPQRGSKDISDALAGVCFQLRKYSLEQPLPMLQSMNPDADPWMTAAFQSHGIQQPVVQLPSSGAQKSDILPPFIGSGFS